MTGLNEYKMEIGQYRQKLLADGELVHLRVGRQSRADYPLVSVITPMFNSAATIEDCLASIRQQTYPNIEHIVVDGLSQDGGFELVLKHEDTLDVIVRGKDRSAAEACNKGVSFCRGEFLCTLPSDDMYEPNYVANAVAAMQRTGGDFVFGDLVLLRDGRDSLLVPGTPDYAGAILYSMPNVNSVSVLYRRATFDEVGLWNVADRYSCDYDWLLRAHLAGFKGYYDPAIRVWYRYGGISTSNFFKALAETRVIALRHGGPAGRIYWNYISGVARTWVRNSLEWLLPSRLYYAILRRSTRTGIRPVSAVEENFLKNLSKRDAA